MNGQEFSLVPFPASRIPEITITGSIARQGNNLALHYILSGSIDQVHLPSRASTPVRRDDLWRTTCFEFFLAIPGLPGYWEFNLSPSGDWNIYHMEAYRRIGFREERGCPELPIESQLTAESFALEARVNVGTIVGQAQPLEAGIAAVIRTKDRHQSYWALAHPAARADFHVRESFILALAGQIHPSISPAPGD